MPEEKTAELTVMQKKVAEMEPLVALAVQLGVARTLAMEIKGLRFKVNVAEQARQLCGSTKRKKVLVLRDYVAWLNETLPGGYAATGSVARVLAGE